MDPSGFNSEIAWLKDFEGPPNYICLGGPEGLNFALTEPSYRNDVCSTCRKHDQCMEVISEAC